MIGDTAQALTDLIDTQRSVRLEVIIVLLIVFEIVITFYQMFIGLKHSSGVGTGRGCVIRGGGDLMHRRSAQRLLPRSNARGLALLRRHPGPVRAWWRNQVNWRLA